MNLGATRAGIVWVPSYRGLAETGANQSMHTEKINSAKRKKGYLNS